jgi:hypothetical protein
MKGDPISELSRFDTMSPSVGSIKLVEKKHIKDLQEVTSPSNKALQVHVVPMREEALVELERIYIPIPNSEERIKKLLDTHVEASSPLVANMEDGTTFLFSQLEEDYM